MTILAHSACNICGDSRSVDHFADVSKMVILGSGVERSE